MAGVMVAAITDTAGSLGVIAMDDLVEPGGGVGGDISHLTGRATLAKQPQDLPMTTFNRIAGLAIVPLQLVDRQMISQFQSSHTISIHPYLVLFTDGIARHG